MRTARKTIRTCAFCSVGCRCAVSPTLQLAKPSVTLDSQHTKQHRIHGVSSPPRNRQLVPAIARERPLRNLRGWTIEHGPPCGFCDRESDLRLVIRRRGGREPALLLLPSRSLLLLGRIRSGLDVLVELGTIIYRPIQTVEQCLEVGKCVICKHEQHFCSKLGLGAMAEPGVRS